MNVVALATCWIPGVDEITATAAITLDIASGLVNAGLAYSQGDYVTGTEALATTAIMALPGAGAAEGAGGDVARMVADDGAASGAGRDRQVPGEALRKVGRILRAGVQCYSW